ncbi:uncharacterized protein IAS62_004265 [Cryptococcus decagattii]|uniref:DNA mismatch repair protein S5 domain-containing protein n=1 Tax=Cryptococcus decagattii TaxID=1859122 RepID=A0ABZ2AZR6_9TREE
MSEDSMDIDLQPEVEEIEPEGPKPIRKLTKDVINQIAAAEIIHRPSNAIKELLENSLDAGSTSIKISVKDGGLKLLQITDNGHGINKDDLPLLCERYATSKLQKFEDLQSLGTYGFRGEALASISYCSHVEVVTKTKNEGCGWKAHYQDGSLIPAKPGGTSDPKPAAANDGTVITAADLFYNMPLRKRAFKSTSDEYNRIIDVVTKYAIHNPHVAWVGSNTKANIAALYTSALANELLEIPDTELQPARLGAKLTGWVSNANSSWSKKGGWLLFINNRLVDSNKLKKAIEGHYTSYLPKGASPWVYLSLQIDPAKIDVNVHPTKSEVRFLNEDEIVDAVVQAVQTALEGANLSRSFTVQTLLPGAPTPLGKHESSNSLIASASFSARKAAPNYKVRMDPSNRTLDSMFTVIDPSQLSGFVEDEESQEQERPAKRRNVDSESQGDEPIMLDDDEEDNEGQAEEGERERVFVDEEENAKGKAKEIEESLCHFTSIQSLRRAVKRDGNAELIEIFRRHAFVGVVDRYQCLSLIQHSTKLFLVNHGALGDEHFYQLGLRQFGAFNRIRLDPAPQLKELLTLAAEDEAGLREAGLEVESVVDYVASLLRDRREMLDEYFSLLITEDGKVETLPMLLKGYTPNLDRLPQFLLCLGTQVDWDNEKGCFQTFLCELAFFYSPRPFEDQPPPRTKDENMNEDEVEGIESTPEEIQHQLWQLEHVLFPSFRRYTVWPKSCMAHVSQLADLPDLFRIFERC